MDFVRKSSVIDLLFARAKVAGGIEYQNFFYDLAKLIEELPAVDAEPVRHGRWIFNRSLPDKCSVCGFFCGRHDDDYADMYCPHCGAKMDGGADDD